MKKIINRKVYDTETATLICGKNNYENGIWQSTKELYKSKKGTYFFAVVGNSSDILAPNDYIEIIEKYDAKDFCEEFGEAEDYEKAFGEVEEG